MDYERHLICSSVADLTQNYQRNVSTFKFVKLLASKLDVLIGRGVFCKKNFRDTSSMPQKVWYGSKTFFEAFQCDIKAFILKVLSQVWDNFWQLKELQKWWRMMVFIRKLFPLSRYLNFRLDFLVLYKNSLINVKIVNGLMWKLWRRILVKKQLQYTYWPIFQEVKASR